MQYLTEILKIIEGGLQLDSEKIVSYSKLLSKNLESVGDLRSSTRILNKLNGKSSNILLLQKFNNLPIDNESKSELADVLDMSNEKIDIFLSEYVLTAVDNFIKYIDSSDLLINEGVGISPSMLIYGPPGCGKTQLAHFIASKLNLPLIVSRSDTLISSYLGSTAKNIRQLFEYVNSRPCILFLDEFDALAKVRDDHNELGELKRVVVGLLQNIDALDPDTILLAATNHEHLLDPAVWRRFNFKINLTFPEKKIREKIIHKYSGGIISSKMVQILAVSSVGLSGSEMKNIVENGLRKKIVNNNEEIDYKEIIYDFLRASDNILDLSDEGVTVKYLRSLNSKVFTYETINEIFNFSLGKISNLLK